MTAPPLNLTDDELREGLTACLDVPRWVEDVVAAAPYASVAELVDTARDKATPLTPDEVDQAMAHHPRIGEKARGEGVAQSFAKAEQSASQDEDPELAAALRQGNADYEARFNRVFLIRAAGRGRAEILAELRRRLTLPPDEEIAIVGSELGDIAALRIPQLFAHLNQHSGYDDLEAAQ